MKLLYTAFIFSLILGGCGKNRDEMISASEEFKKLFLSEVSSVSSVDTTSGRTDYGDVYLSKSEFSVHNEAFNPSTTYGAGRAALSRWEVYNDFDVKSSGGGGNHFFVNYGNGSDHIFIDIIGYKLNGENRIDYLVRAK